MEEKLISIIVAVYNVEKYIDQTIMAIRNQTYNNIEIILVDDGSNDGSLKICNSYAEIDNRIMVIHQNNMGPGYARNAGIKIAKGEYLTFIDSDDCVSETFVEHLVTAIMKENFDLAIAGYKKRCENKIVDLVIPKKISSNDNDLSECLADFAKNSLIQGPCWKLFKKNIIVENNIFFHEKWKYGEDSYFVYKYLSNIKTWTTVPVADYCYEIRGNESLSGRFTKEKITNSINLMWMLREICTIKTDTAWIGELLCGCFITYCDDLIGTEKNFREKIDNIKWAVRQLNESRELLTYVEKHHIRSLYKFCILHKMNLVIYGLAILRYYAKRHK